MNIEEFLRSEMETAASTVPTGAPALLSDIERRGRRRILVARIGLAATSVAVFVAVVGVSIAVGRIGATPDVVGSARSVAESTVPPTTSAPVIDGHVVIAGETFPVDGLVETFAETQMYFGAPTPQPGFDTSPLGSELPLGFGQAGVGDPDVLNGPTIYLGEVGGVSVFVNQRLLDDGPSKCLWMGGTPQVCGDAGAFKFAEPPFTSQPGGLLLGAWLGVPKGTSVIVLRADGVELGWQRPVGGVAVVPLPKLGIYELAALDQSGTELETVNVTLEADRVQGVAVPGSPTTTVP